MGPRVVRFLAAAVVLALGVPVAGSAQATARALLEGPGEQTAPSLSNGRLAYLDEGVVRLATVDGAPLWALSSGADGAISWPSLRGDFAAWRTLGAVHVVHVADAARAFDVAAGGTGRTALGPVVVAWEQPELPASPGSGDVAWRRVADGVDGATTVRALPGTQGAVATAGSWVAWIDFDAPGSPADATSTGTAAGAVHLLDTASGEPGFDVAVPNGSAERADSLVDLAIELPAGSDLPRLAVTVLPGNGDLFERHVVVLDGSGTVLARLATEGQKINPHLVGPFVGFEDVSLVDRVSLWDWTAPFDPVTGPVVHVPSFSGAVQRLHDVELYQAPDGERIRVAWAEASDLGDLDVWLFDAPLPLDADVDPPDEPARCDDADPVLLGELEATRLTAKPRVHGGRVTFDAPVNVLVCMDAVDVTAAGVVVGTRVVASTGDFGRGEVHREARIAVPAGDGAIGAILAGKPGGTLRVRVLRDGETVTEVPPDVDTCVADGTCKPPPPGLTKGCNSSGGAGVLALLLLPGATLLARRRRRS